MSHLDHSIKCWEFDIELGCEIQKLCGWFVALNVLICEIVGHVLAMGLPQGVKIIAFCGPTPARERGTAVLHHRLQSKTLLHGPMVCPTPGLHLLARERSDCVRVVPVKLVCPISANNADVEVGVIIIVRPQLAPCEQALPHARTVLLFEILGQPQRVGVASSAAPLGLRAGHLQDD